MSEVFISYRHGNDHHCARVRKFAEQLEAAGVTVILDAFAEQREFHGGAPPRGWPIWSTQAASNARSVIAIASSGSFRILNLPLLEQSLAIDERLAVSDSSNVTWQNDVRVSRRLVAEARKKAN